MRRVQRPLTAATLLCAIVLAASAQQSGDQAMLNADFPVLSKRMAQQGQSADFVILIDKSRSMNRFWTQVQGAVSSFVQAIPEGDYLSLVAFGNNADYMGTPTVINAATRANVLNAISDLREPPDTKTDLGRALEKCLDELNRPNGSKLKFVFFLTDFNHEPEPGSPYARTADPRDALWQALAQRREHELSDKVMETYALLIPLEPTVGRNLNLGDAVFPRLQRIPVARDTLGQWFERRRAEIARDKLRAYVSDDLQKQAFTVERVELQPNLKGSQADVVAWLRPTERRMVDLPGLRGVSSSVAFDGPAPPGVTIETAPPQDVTFANVPQPVKVATLRWAETPWVQEVLESRLQVKLEGQQEAGPAEEIRKLDLSNAGAFEASHAAPVTIRRGLLPLWDYVAAAFALAALVLFLLWYFRPEYIAGEVSVVGVAKRKILKSERKRRFVVGNVPKGEGLTVPNVAWRLSLRAFRPFEDGQKRRGVYARMETGTGALVLRGKRQTLGGSWTWLPRGSTVEVAGQRVIWS
jgi:Mg-chelatase subunit ChlD